MEIQGKFINRENKEAVNTPITVMFEQLEDRLNITYISENEPINLFVEDSREMENFDDYGNSIGFLQNKRIRYLPRFIFGKFENPESVILTKINDILNFEIE